MRNVFSIAALTVGLTVFMNFCPSDLAKSGDRNVLPDKSSNDAPIDGSLKIPDTIDDSLSQTDRASLPMEWISGTWIENGYLDLLKKTRDPREAASSTSVPLLEIAKDAKGLVINVCYNFHEGWPIHPGDLKQNAPHEWTFHFKDGVIAAIKLRVEEDKSSLLVSLLSEDSLRQPLPFKTYSHFAGKYQQLLDSIVIVGEYRNERGERVSFLKNGRIVWPKGNNRFEVCYDYIEDYGASCFLTLHENRRMLLEAYAFKWKDNTLELFLVDEEAHRVGKSFMTLRPMH